MVKEISLFPIIFNVILCGIAIYNGALFDDYTVDDPDGHLSIAIDSYSGSIYAWFDNIKINAFYYSWFTSPGVYLFDSFAFISMMNIAIATINFSLLLKIYKKIWGEYNVLICFIALIFPMSYFFIPDPTIREVVIVFFMLIALDSLISYEFNKNKISLFSFIISIVFATILHSAFGLIFVGYALFRLTRELSFSNFVYCIVLIAIVIAAYSVGAFDNKLNMLDNSDLETLQAGAARGRTAYPEFLNSESLIGSIVKLPVRVVAFYTLPWPNMINKFADIVGFIDSFFYIFPLLIAFKYRDVIRNHKSLILVLFIFTFLTLAFAYGTSNYGTAIRHRFKLYYLLLLFIPSATYFKMRFKISR